jgi:hypothetical protein
MPKSMNLNECERVGMCVCVRQRKALYCPVKVTIPGYHHHHHHHHAPSRLARAARGLEGALVRGDVVRVRGRHLIGAVRPAGAVLGAPVHGNVGVRAARLEVSCVWSDKHIDEIPIFNMYDRLAPLINQSKPKLTKAPGSMGPKFLSRPPSHQLRQPTVAASNAAPHGVVQNCSRL